MMLTPDALLTIAPTFFSGTRPSPFFERGFEVLPGWFDVLLETFIAIEAINVALTMSERVTCAQVKEKFGGLRIYYDGPANAAVRAVIDKADKKATRTCECCGHVNGNWR